MKQLVKLLVVAAMLLMPVSMVAAQGGGEGDFGTFAWGSGITWNSSMQIQNVDPSEPAAVQLCYYSQTNPTAPTCITPGFSPLAAGASAPLFPAVPDSVGTTFNGSVVVNSDREVVAISNILNSTYKYGAAYEGTAAGALKVSLPIVQFNNAGRYYSQFNVQNAGSTQATAIVYFYREGETSATTTVNLTIDPGAAKTVDPQTLPWFIANPGKWVGSVVISSTNGVPLAAVAELLDSSPMSTSNTGLYAYSGFTSGGATELYLPTIMDANGGYWTAVNVQNAGPDVTNITIEYYPESGYPAKASQTINNVAVGGTAVFLQNMTGTKWVGAAKVSSSNSSKLYAVVNELNTVVGEGSSYSGFELSGATNKIYAPLVMDANGGYWTSINVMNLSGSSQTVTVDYFPSAGYAAKASATKTVGNNAAGVFLQNPTGTKWVGSAIISVPAGGKIVAIVNELNTAKAEPAETFLTYNAFNK